MAFRKEFNREVQGDSPARKCWAGLALVLSLASVAAAQTSPPVAVCVPEKPLPGTTAEIRYQAGQGGSRFSVKEKVYAAATIVLQGHGFMRRQWLMRPDGEDLKASIGLPSDAAFLAVYFITLSTGSADTAPLRVPLFGADRRPVRNAMAASMDGSNFEANARSELALYPDNWAVYRDKWFHQGLGGSESAAKGIASDLAKLEPIAKDTPELLYARSYGALLLKDEPGGRAVLKRMLSAFPLSPLTGAAVGSYYYLAMTNHASAEATADMDRAVQAAAKLHPEVAAAREWVGLGRPCPLELAERIYGAWISAEADDPLPYQHLAVALNRENRDLERASQLIEKSLELTLGGRFRLIYDLFGKRTDFHLGNLYLTAASIRHKLGDPLRALAYLQAARNAPGSSPRAFLIEGDVWAGLGDLKAAERAYAEAWKKGLEETRDRLRTIYDLTSRPAGGDFEGYLKALGPLAGAASDARPGPAAPAPSFSVRDLEGKALDSKGLLGKAVVINFWYVGCAPCQAEIPDLNRLAARYGDVVFIAFSLTEADGIRRFLKDHPFGYRQVAAAGEIAKAFGVKVYPTHVILDAQGNVYHQRFGGGPSIYDELAPVLDRLTGRTSQAPGRPAGARAGRPR